MYGADDLYFDLCFRGFSVLVSETYVCTSERTMSGTQWVDGSFPGLGVSRFMLWCYGGGYLDFCDIYLWAFFSGVGRGRGAAV